MKDERSLFAKLKHHVDVVAIRRAALKSDEVDFIAIEVTFGSFNARMQYKCKCGCKLKFGSDGKKLIIIP